MTPALKSLGLLFLMLLSALLTATLRPNLNLADTRPPIHLQTMLPTRFGDWQEQPNGPVQIIDPQQQDAVANAYDQTVARTYTNSQGYSIMLSVAYGKSQRGSLQLHHPELCYPAQGFAVQSNRVGELQTPYGALPVRRMQTQLNPDRQEPVTYWAMVGDRVVLGSVQRKLVEMRYGLHGHITDGLLFRVSSIDKTLDTGFNQQAAFISALLLVLSPNDRHRIAGI
jgi:EpsI family protein